MDWPEIPGVTQAEGRARLPRDPGAVVRVLNTAIEAARNGGIGFHELVERARVETGIEPQRLEGLAGWLPLSHVALWAPSTGRLWLHEATDLVDLAHRYAAWVGAQPIPSDQVRNVTQYARTIVERANALQARRPAPGKAANEPPPATPRPVEEPEDAPLVPPELTARLRRIVGVLDATFLERRRHTRAALLALLAGQHVLLLGPPGTAKSMLARALCKGFSGARYFEYLLSRFTHPDELFGPVSIPGLKDEDYRRLTEGFLPAAHIAFLDEIFKANSAILNSLLTLVNERIFHHGRHRDPVPLIGLIGASNELPDPEGGLEALYDRFLVRLSVPPLGEAEAFLRVATGRIGGEATVEAPLDESERAQLSEAAARVEVPEPVADALIALWRVAAREDWGVSDRRWRQAVHLLKLGVAADGRRRLSPLDLLLLEPILPPTPERAAEVRDVLHHLVAPGTVPEHDLRAQWTLLHADRVAPTDEEPHPERPEEGAAWDVRLGLRRRSVERFLVHHRDAVSRLADDRRRIERIGDHHLWLESLPVEMLSAHIEASRDLADILSVAERYREALSTPEALAQALLDALPEPARRYYGHGVACTLTLSESGQQVGLTLSGERVTPPRRVVSRRDSVDRPAEGGGQSWDPVLVVSSRELLDWVDGKTTTETLLAQVPAWAGRNAAVALDAVRQRLSGSALPEPPDLPGP